MPTIASSLDWAIALPLLLFAFYGMNVRLPFADHPHTWIYLLVVSVVWVATVVARDARH